VTLVPSWLLAMIGGVLVASAVVLVVTWPRVLGPHVVTLDRYAAASLLAVVAMVLWPAAYFSHYGAVAGPFLALALVWPAMRLSRAWSGVKAVRDPRLRSGIAALFAAATIGATGVSDFAAVTSLWTPVSPAASADQLIPPGACVFTNDAALTITADRFFSGVPGCPVMVDSFGTLLALTGGHSGTAPPAQLAAVTARLRSALSRARYVWIAPAMIDWTRDLRGYFDQRFRLIGLATGVATSYAPAPGLYIARWSPSAQSDPLSPHPPLDSGAGAGLGAIARLGSTLGPDPSAPLAPSAPRRRSLDRPSW
jgi:hypothetical protein